MARSAEKAMTALARWRAAYVLKLQEDKRRPYHTIECQDCKDAMVFRRQIVHELTKKITQIQNPSLGEYKIRDLNDEINKLIKEKNHWEKRIKELGGPDFAADAPKLLEKDGREAPGYRGYRYFGAARDLPGVRELFEEEPQPPPRKTRGELMKNVDISYYGNCDEDDGIILPREQEYEKQVFSKKIEAYKKRKEEEQNGIHRLKRKMNQDDQDIDNVHQDDQNIYDVGENPVDEELMRLYSELDPSYESMLKNAKKVCLAKSNNINGYNLLSTVEEDMASSTPSFNLAKSISNVSGSIKHAFVAHVPVKSQEEMEQLLIEKRKKQLLSQYMSEDLLATVSQTSALLGHQERVKDINNENNLPKEKHGLDPEKFNLSRNKLSELDPNEAISHHPLYDDSADEDEGNEEEPSDED